MKISEAERAAIVTVVDLGKSHGFGNLIAHLRTAWARTLMERYGLDEESARKGAAGSEGYPLQMHADLLEGWWDETGQRYRKEAAP